ncbi:MAG: ferritin family protein [Desulforegulaceae bacterium]|nr:ferritin family protein [Desulforegulaceae bacterium]
MSYNFNADEVFQVAVKIEENAAEFYRQAAGLQEEAENVLFLEKLANMEDTHRDTFDKMRKKLSGSEKEKTVFDPDNELTDYLMSMAEYHGGEGSADAAKALTGKETIEEIVNIAIGLEKESILFYIGILYLVPDAMGQDKINEIIKEEQRHIVQLQGFLRKMKSK